MRKAYWSALIATSLLASNISFADTSSTKTTFPPVNWVSKSSSDVITIQNGANLPIMVVITVNGANPKPPGISVSNCGNTNHVDAGSSAVCTNNDSSNPVNFKSDSGTLPSSGTYQIKQQ